MVDYLNKDNLYQLLDDQFGKSRQDYINFYKLCGRFLKHHPIVETETINNHRNLFRFIYQTYSYVDEYPSIINIDRYDHQQFVDVRTIVFARSQTTMNIITLYYAQLIANHKSNVIFDLILALTQSSVVSFIRYCNLRYCGYPNSFSYLSHLYRRYEDASLMIPMLNLLFGLQLDDNIANQWEKHSFQLLFLFSQPSFKNIFAEYINGKITVEQFIEHRVIYQHFNPEFLGNYKAFLIDYLLNPLKKMESNISAILKNDNFIVNQFHFIHNNYMQFKFINYGHVLDDIDECNDNSLLIRKFYHLTKSEFLHRLKKYMLTNEINFKFDAMYYQKYIMSREFQQFIFKMNNDSANLEIETIVHLFDHFIMDNQWNIKSNIIIPLLKVY